MNSINLLEDKKGSPQVAFVNKLRKLRFTAVGLLFLVATSSVMLFIFIALSPLPQLKNQEKLVVVTLSQYHTDMMKLLLIKERTTVIESILSKRRSYDQLLDAIQSRLPGGVEVRSLNIETGTLSLTVSSKSLDLLNTFTSNLANAVAEKKIFSQVILNNISVEERGGNYLAALTLLTL